MVWVGRGRMGLMAVSLFKRFWNFLKPTKPATDRYLLPGSVGGG